MRDQVGQVGGEMEDESNERDIWKRGVHSGVGRNLVPRKLPGIHMDEPAKIAPFLIIFHIKIRLDREEAGTFVLSFLFAYNWKLWW